MVILRSMNAPSPVLASGLEAAKRAVGGQSQELAKRLNLSKAAISKWKGVIPLKRVLDVERATGVPRYVLRPDVFGPAPEQGKAA